MSIINHICALLASFMATYTVVTIFAMWRYDRRSR